MSRNYRLTWLLSLVALSVVLLVTSCSGGSQTDPVDEPEDDEVGDYIPQVQYLPNDQGTWEFLEKHAGSLPVEEGQIIIDGIGVFNFDARVVERTRPDIFVEGHFSIFDALLHLDKRGDIELDYYFDETMNTHVVNTINGESGWWYGVKYPGGWFEDNAFRMDMYPYKDWTDIQLYKTTIEGKVEQIYRSFRREVSRLSENNGEVIIPRVTIGHKTFRDLKVTAHNVRNDVLQPGVITALDIILSLADQGEISRLKFTWYESIGVADPVDNYWMELIDFGDGLSDDEASGGCGWVYETGPENLPGFLGSHIHIPMDVRVIVSTDYAHWFWICL